MISINLSKLKTSWTKFDIVQVMEIIHDRATFEKYLSGEAKIDQPILKAFLGVKSLNDSIPSFWYEILKYPKDKKIFALFAVIFTHVDVINKFVRDYSLGKMKGVFHYEKGKQFTNIRSALIESGAAELYLRRAQEVPYDFSPIFNNTFVGVLFKQLLLNRFSLLGVHDLNDSEFYATCFANNLHTAISANKELFRSWCEGKEYQANKTSYIDCVNIENFYSIKSINVDLPENTKEIYFLGENGDGKSLLLMAIFLAFNRHYILNSTEKEETGKVADLLNVNKDAVLDGVDSRGRSYTNKYGTHIDGLFAYGTYRGRYSTDNSEKYGFMSLFDNNEALANPISWLKDQKLKELSSNTNSSTVTSLSIDNIENVFADILEKNIVIKFEESEVLFIEKGRKVEFDQLSEGYKSIIIFLVDLLLRLQLKQPRVKNIKDFTGVVLVDEIDLHLHPKWQRSLVSKLRKLLPRIQFFFTTHSPNIIQGAGKDAVIYRVYRNSNDGYTRISNLYLRSDIDHLMINTLLTSPLFGLSDSRLNEGDNLADTSEDYLIYRIHKKLELELENQKNEGKEFASDSQIDSLIDKLLAQEINSDEKD